MGYLIFIILPVSLGFTFGENNFSDKTKYNVAEIIEHSLIKKGFENVAVILEDRRAIVS